MAGNLCRRGTLLLDRRGNRCCDLIDLPYHGPDGPDGGYDPVAPCCI